MPAIVPLSNTTTTFELVTLNGTTYTFRTYYNESAKMWFLDIIQGDDNVAVGLALVPNVNILQYSANLQETIGELRILDLNGEGNKETHNLGVDALLIYFTPGEFETLFPDYNTLDYRPLPYDPADMFVNTNIFWILVSGFWQDENIWVDGATWKDGP